MKGLDWPAMLRMGMQTLRLTPAQFWALTPAELRLLMGPGSQREPLDRTGLVALMAAHPDDLPDGDQGEIDD